MLLDFKVKTGLIEEAQRVQMSLWFERLLEIIEFIWTRTIGNERFYLFREHWGVIILIKKLMYLFIVDDYIHITDFLNL